MLETLEKVDVQMGEPKKQIRRVSISKQQQMNIPKYFYAALGFMDEATIEFTGKEIFICPAATEVDFSEYILRDLVEEGFSGDV